MPDLGGKMISLPAPVIVRNRLGCHSCKGNLRTDREDDGPILVCIKCGRRHEYRERPKHQEETVMPVKRGKCANCGREDQKIVKDLCMGLCYFYQRGKVGEERDRILKECREKVEKMNLGQNVRGFRKPAPAAPAEKRLDPPAIPAATSGLAAAPARPVELHFHVNLTAEFMNVIEKALKEARA